MREIRTSGSTRGEWVVLMSDIAHSPTLLAELSDSRKSRIESRNQFVNI